MALPTYENENIIESQSTKVNYLIPFSLVTSLFFLWGLANSLNGTLVKQFQTALDLQRWQANIVETAFYLGYFIMALPAGYVMKKLGYKMGILIGLVLYAAGAFLFAWARKALTWNSLMSILVESARTTGMLFTLLIAATVFANFVNFTTMPGDLKEWITHLGLSPVMVVGAMMVIYIILGTVMEELTMVLLTIPLFFPIVMQLGFDPVWFGVLIVMVIQIGLISPPVGMNLFVLNTLLPKVGLGTIFRGCWPFVVMQVVTLAILLFFPEISLYLPSLMDN